MPVVPEPTASLAEALSALVLEPLARELALIADGPRLSSSSGELLREIEIVDEYGDHRLIHVPVERELTVLLDGRQVGKLWTLGAQPDWLVVGYLRNRKLVSSVTEIDSIAVEWAEGTASVFTRRAYPIDPRLIVAGSQAEPRRLALEGRLTRSALLAVLQIMRGNDAIYRAAGSVQACALFRGADLLLSVEDVSRRNCFDTIAGWMALHGVSGEDKVLFTTGRLTAEVVLKTASSGIPVIVSRKGITSACFDLAARLGMTLIGHANQRGYICYVGAERFDAGT